MIEISDVTSIYNQSEIPLGVNSMKGGTASAGVKKINQNDYDDKARIGDHICYYSDLTKIKNDFDDWEVKKSLDYIFEDVYLSLKKSIK